MQKTLKSAVLRLSAARLAHCLMLAVFVCIAGRVDADTSINSACPTGDISTVEYLKLSPAEQQETIEGYRQAYRPAMETVVDELRQLFADKPVTIQFRLKTIASIQEKLVRKGYRCLSQMTDIAGVRVLIPDYAAIPFVSHEVQTHFAVREKQDLINDPRRTGYRAIHYLVAAKDHIVELQIHTVRGTIWALLTYDLVYKGPYHSNEAAGRYFMALSRALYLLDSGFEGQRLPTPTNLPPKARSKIQRGLMLIQGYDAEQTCLHMEETLEHVHDSGLAQEDTDYYGIANFNLSYGRFRFAGPTPKE